MYIYWDMLQKETFPLTSMKELQTIDKEDDIWLCPQHCTYHMSSSPCPGSVVRGAEQYWPEGGRRELLQFSSPILFFWFIFLFCLEPPGLVPSDANRNSARFGGIGASRSQFWSLFQLQIMLNIFLKNALDSCDQACAGSGPVPGWVGGEMGWTRPDLAQA